MSYEYKPSKICSYDKCMHSIKFRDRGQERFIPLHLNATDLQRDRDPDRLAVDIFQLRNTPIELLEGAHDFQGPIPDMKGLHAPMCCLPVEILGEIFSRAVEIEAMQGYSSTISKGWNGYKCRLPLQTLHLSQVCRLWRHITMSSPLLWCFDKWAISLTAAPGAANINLVSHYLEMSKPLPLSLQLINFAYNTGPELLKVVLSHSARLRYVFVEVSPPLLKAIERILQSLGSYPVGGYFPNLEEADLRTSELLLDNTTMLATDVFATASKLRSLAIDHFQPKSTALPYKQLDELTFGGFNGLTDWVTLLRLGLKRLILFRKFSDPLLRWLSSVSPTPVVCPSILLLCMHTDSLCSDYRAGLAMLSGALILPSLEALHLSSSIYNQLDASSFRALLSRPWCLRELCLYWQVIPRADLCEIFQLVPGLTKLKYHCLPSVLGPLVELLTVQNGAGTAVLPALLHLDIGLVVYSYIMDAITMMVASRWRQSDSGVVSL